jgi:putative redox protein
LAVHVKAEKAMQPARLDQFRIEVDIPPSLDERHKEGVKRAVEKCLIHNTLLHPPRIEVLPAEVHEQVPATTI